MGLGFLFFGMEIMSGELKSLSSHPMFMEAFQTFKCAPIDGVIPPLSLLGAIGIGLIATVVVQSSSACSGIVVALAASGLIDIYTGVALILGSNVGTTITAQLAAIPANRVAKQAALAHTLFNVIGVVMMVATFWFTIEGEPIFFKIVKMVSSDGTLQRQIANAHTIFNVFTTLVLIIFIPLLARICERAIPVKNERVKFQRLEPHLLNTPSIALTQTADALRKMLKKSWKMADRTLRIYNKNDEENQKFIENLDKHESDVDERQKDITSYLSKLMQCGLTSEEAEQIPLLLHCTNDAERIGDLSATIRDIMMRIKENKYTFSTEAENEFNELHSRLAGLAEMSIKLLESKSHEDVEQAKLAKVEITTMLSSLESDHISRVNEGICRPEVGISYLELLESVRKVAKNLFNIIDRAENFYDKFPKLGKRRIAVDVSAQSVK